MACIRGVRGSRLPFVQILNSMFNDKYLSMKCKGFIGFCLTQKSDWHISVSQLCQFLKEGEDAIYAMINECIKHGYAYRYRTRNQKGQLGTVEIVISDSKFEILKVQQEIEADPLLKKFSPHRENPGVENPGVVSLGKPTPIHISNTILNNTKEQQQEPAAPAAAFVKADDKKASPKVKAKPLVQVYPILADIDIPQHDKVEITLRYSEDIVVNATAWALHPETKIKQTLVQAIKWACQTQPAVRTAPVDKIEANKALAKRYDGLKSQIARLDALGGCVEIVYSNTYIDVFSIRYNELGFEEQLQSAMRKAHINIP